MRVPPRGPAARRAAPALGATLLALALPPTLPIAAQTPAPLTELERAVHLLGRATFGVRAQDVAEVLRVGREAWLDHQLDGPRPYRLPGRPLFAGEAAVRDAPGPAGAQQPEPASGERAMAPARAEPAVVRVSLGRLTPATLELIGEKVLRAVASPYALEEVMADFWFDHFNVHYDKAQVQHVLADYERTAIRPYVFGRFEDMLIATARHPAMLMYLDNYLSATLSADSARPSGLNENYARELLELHTLGVNGGYDERDVLEVARAFTGWTVPLRWGRRGQPPTVIRSGRIPFDFQPSWHDREEKVVLGQVLPAGRTLEDGLDVLRLLARHPSTARHVATRLVTRFVADEPPPELVEELARVFLESGGDLREVTRALFTSERFYDPAHYRAKVKRPFDFFASALRASGARLSEAPGDLALQRSAVAHHLQTLRQLPYGEPAPTGYPFVADEWVSAGAMLARWDLALELAGGRLAGVELPPWPAEETPAELARATAARVLPGVDAPALEAWLAAELSSGEQQGGAARAARALALALGSPEFQRH